MITSALVLFCYLGIGFIMLKVQAEPEQRFINDWLNAAPRPSYKLLAIPIWPIVLFAATVHSRM